MPSRRVSTSVLHRPRRLPDDIVFLRIIAKGRHATVWLCEDGRTGEQIACKKILKSSFCDSGDNVAEAGDRSVATRVTRSQPSRDSVRREAIVAEDLSKNHPNILTFRGAFEEADAVYVTSEFCDSGDLLTHIVESAKRAGAPPPDVYNPGTRECSSDSGNRSPSAAGSKRYARGGGGSSGGGIPAAWALAESDARAIFRQVAAGVRFCHASGVAHGDIRLENVLLSSRGYARAGPRQRARALPPIFSAYAQVCASEDCQGSEPLLDLRNGAPAARLFAKLADFGSAKIVHPLPARIDGAEGDVAAGGGAASGGSGGCRDRMSVGSRLQDAAKRGGFGGGEVVIGGGGGGSWVYYAAPEVILSKCGCRQEKESCPSAMKGLCPLQADVWSLGVVLFALLSSSVPFCGPNLRELLRQMARAGDHIDSLMFQKAKATCEDTATCATSVWGIVSADAKDLIRGMLEVEPAARLSMDAVVNHPWLQIESGDFDLNGSVTCSVSAVRLADVYEEYAGDDEELAAGDIDEFDSSADESGCSGRSGGSDISKGRDIHSPIGGSFSFTPPSQRRSNFSAYLGRSRSTVIGPRDVEPQALVVSSPKPPPADTNWPILITSLSTRGSAGGNSFVRRIRRSISSLTDLKGLAIGNGNRGSSTRSNGTPTSQPPVSRDQPDIFRAAEEGEATAIPLQQSCDTSEKEIELGGLGLGVQGIGHNPIRGLRHRRCETVGANTPGSAHTAAAAAAAVSATVPTVYADAESEGLGFGLQGIGYSPIRGLRHGRCETVGARTPESTHAAAAAAAAGASATAAAAAAVSGTALLSTEHAGVTSLRARGRSKTDAMRRLSSPLNSAYSFQSTQFPNHSLPENAACPADGAAGNPSPGYSSGGAESDGEGSSGSGMGGLHQPITASSSGNSNSSGNSGNSGSSVAS